jgi:subtilase family serine protease
LGAGRRRLLGAAAGLAAACLAAAGLLITAAGSAQPASAAGSAPARPASGGGPAKPVGSPAGIGPTADCNSLTTCYTPQELQVAYGVKPLLDRGIDGRGETVVLPEVGEVSGQPPAVSDIRQDLAKFDALFHLPAAHLRALTTLAGGSAPWLAYGEEVLDVEMVHAIAPGASIDIVVLPPTALANHANAVASAIASLRLAGTLGGIVSASEGGQVGGEQCTTRTDAERVDAVLRADASRHVTVVAAAGDSGAAAESCSLIPQGSYTPVKGVTLISSDPYVLGAGGTTLTASRSTGAWISETAWGLPYGDPGSLFQASSGGFSRFFARAAYQDGVPGIGAARGVPDVSADANGHTAMAMVISTGADSRYIRDDGGTSAAAPLWAALIALADQYAGRHLGFVNPAIYRIAESASYHQAFHDITSGNNTAEFPPITIAGYHAHAGWDPVTGWGSPDAQYLIPLLARYAS